MVVGSPRPMMSLSLGSWLGFQARYGFPLAGSCLLQHEYACHHCTLRAIVPCWLLLGFLSVYMCVPDGSCMRKCVQVCVCVHACEGQGLTLDAFLSPSPNFVETESSAEPGAIS